MDINSRDIARFTICRQNVEFQPGNDQKFKEKGQHNSPEDLTHQFPEKRGTGFPKCDQVNFPETGSEFREIGVFLGNQVIFLGD